MRSIDLFNAGLASLAFLAAFGSLNKMSRETRPCVIAGTFLIAIGLAGQVFGYAYRDLAPGADTALFGGLVVMLLATQKVPSWWGERWANPLASVVAVVTVAAFMAALAMPAQAQQSRGVQMDCSRLARLIDASSSYRDTGADLTLFIAWLHKVGSDLPQPQREVVAREVRRMWKEKLPGEDAGIAVYTRCTQQLGDMGREG